jgi:hypothetical protein
MRLRNTAHCCLTGVVIFFSKWVRFGFKNPFFAYLQTVILPYWQNALGSPTWGIFPLKKQNRVFLTPWRKLGNFGSGSKTEPEPQHDAALAAQHRLIIKNVTNYNFSYSHFWLF